MESDKLCYGEYLKLWKGLFYCMWMADKPKYQHELAERLARLTKSLSLAPKDDSKEGGEEGTDEDEPVDLADILPPALLYVRAFWETMCREWRGIDRLRLNKYYYLMQQFLKVSFELLESAEFEQEFTCLYFSLLGEFPLKYDITLYAFTHYFLVSIMIRFLLVSRFLSWRTMWRCCVGWSRPSMPTSR